jgi:hypothetical protein
MARASGSGVLAGALQAAGYWPVPDASAESAADAIDASIEHEVARRLALLGRWLAERRAAFAAVFAYEERRALRFWLRVVANGGPRPPPKRAPGAAALPARLRDELAAAADGAALVAALRRAASPWAEPLADALREHPDQTNALEPALDRAFAAHALAAARPVGGRLLAFVRDGIDLENAWDALAGGSAFAAGGRLAAGEHAAVAADPDEVSRRRRLARRFARTPLARIFDEPDLATAALESRARAVRIANEQRAARVDPLGPAPILTFVLRLRAERAELRRINQGIAQGWAPAAIAAQRGL